MEENNEILKELLYSGYIVTDEFIPWADHLHHRVKVQSLFEKENELMACENISPGYLEKTKGQYLQFSSKMLLKKIMREIKERGWKLERSAIYE